MATKFKDLDRYLLITSDTHAGLDPEGYRPYIEKKYHDDFNEWVKAGESLAQIMRQVMGKRSIGVDGDPDLDGNRNWDSARRLSETQADGVVAEVIFPNTVPPFAPMPMSAFEEPHVGDELEKRWAGLQAHNRWLADFCAEAPGRRAGVAQILLPNIEGSIEEIHWAKENGLTGGVLLPGAPPGSGVPPLYAPEYEPIWATCAELEMPLNHHSGGSTPDFGFYMPQSMAMFMLEVTWWAHRALWHLMFSGVFERHPNLQFVLTETGTGWVPEKLRELDSFYDRMKNQDQCSEHKFGGPAVEKLSLKPSEYFARQCHIGSSFLHPREFEMRDQIGVDQIMWGSDYPHIEGSYPYTRELLRLVFAGADIAEIQQIVAGNAAKVYGFDLDFLAPFAAQFGPTHAEIAKPLDYESVPAAAQKCPGFAPQNQRQH
ncbi:MAG: amidohydrolase family protein [Myxococcota bacterium]